LAIMSEKELEQIKTDLRGLLEANQLAWLQLATQECPREVRANLRKSIAQRNQEIGPLFRRKWELEDQMRKDAAQTS
jgi:hypothetical protein